MLLVRRQDTVDLKKLKAPNPIPDKT
jgi:hypothetical protein